PTSLHASRLFYFLSCGAHRDLHSFPTRRSSDLDQRVNPERIILCIGKRHESSGRRTTPAECRGPSLQCRKPLQVHSGWCARPVTDRKSTRLNSSHVKISYAVFCLKKKINTINKH